jgi:hypothetical protein
MASYPWFLFLILGKDKIKIKPLTTGPIINVLIPISLKKGH